MKNIKDNADPVQRAASDATCASMSSKAKSHVRAALTPGDHVFSEHMSASTATEVQIQKLVALLRVRPHHTHELRACGISHPAGRIHNLIERGYTIDSDRVVTVDSDSFIHRGVALYSLIAEPDGSPA